MDLPVAVAAVNDYEIVVQGLAAMLEGFPDRVVVRDRIIVGEPVTEPVDVALYDTYGRLGVAAERIAELRDEPNVGRIAVFSLQIQPELIVEARQNGATGFISKCLPAEQIIEALERVAAGEDVEALGDQSPPPAELDWPGREKGLSQRESEVLVHAAQGLRNHEIAAALFIGTETVKSHLRSAYSKIGVRNRVEAASFVAGSRGFRQTAPSARRPGG